MLRDLILDGEMDDLLLAAQDVCDTGQSALEQFGFLSEVMVACMTAARDDLGMILACYEDGPRRRYAYPSVRAELRRMEARASALVQA
jgi:hypothetical protein